MPTLFYFFNLVGNYKSIFVSQTIGYLVCGTFIMPPMNISHMMFLKRFLLGNSLTIFSCVIQISMRSEEPITPQIALIEASQVQVNSTEGKQFGENCATVSDTIRVVILRCSTFIRSLILCSHVQQNCEFPKWHLTGDEMLHGDSVTETRICSQTCNLALKSLCLFLR